MNKLDKEDTHLRYLILQAAVTIILVLALLIGLRLSGVISVEDAPLQAVEEAAQSLNAGA